MDKRNLVMFPGTEAVKGAGSIRARVTEQLGQLPFLQRPIHFLAAKKWMILLTFMGFLLGRAMILGSCLHLQSLILQLLPLCVVMYCCR